MQPLARRKKAKRSKLGLLPLVALIFYEVSGGPFGTEVRPRLQTSQNAGSHLLCCCPFMQVSISERHRLQSRCVGRLEAPVLSWQ